MFNQHELPLFPLQTVLFPEMPLPLHIFEPRYIEMIDRCTAEHMAFGVVLIQSGSEVGETAIPYAVGTTARIVHREDLPDGCINLVATGETRFRIIETNHRRAYQTARVDRLEDAAGDRTKLAAAVDVASESFRKYLRTLLALVNRHVSSVQIPSGPRELSYSIANILQIPLAEKQRLLEADCILDRLMREIEILARETDVQESLGQLRGISDDTREIAPVNHDALRRLLSRN